MQTENLLFYDKAGHRAYHDIHDFQIYGTSSAGNSLHIKPYRSLIDLGLPYGKYSKTLFYELKYILLTHEHGDHLHTATIQRILENHSHIKFVMTPRMIDIVNGKMAAQNRPCVPDKSIIPVDFDETIVLDLPDDDVFSIHATKTPHGDVQNVAYTIRGFQDVDMYEAPTILYCSDLSTTLEYEGEASGEHYPGLPRDIQYDLMFLEANYDEDVLHEQLLRDPHDFKSLGNLRHLSEQNAFSYVNRQLSDTGIFIPLHASRDFGTYIHTIGEVERT